MKVFGIVGWRNAGKTTLVERLVAEVAARGLSVSTIKHTHHAVDLDRPGKDTFRHRQAGATEVLLASSSRWALMREARGGAEPTLEQLLARLDPVDLVLVEGFKRHPHPKIEVWRAATGRAPLAAADPTILAVATNGAPPAAGTRALPLDDPAAIARFILAETGLAAEPAG